MKGTSTQLLRPSHSGYFVVVLHTHIALHLSQHHAHDNDFDFLLKKLSGGFSDMLVESHVIGINLTNFIIYKLYFLLLMLFGEKQNRKGNGGAQRCLLLLLRIISKTLNICLLLIVPDIDCQFF